MGHEREQWCKNKSELLILLFVMVGDKKGNIRPVKSNAPIISKSSLSGSKVTLENWLAQK